MESPALMERKEALRQCIDRIHEHYMRMQTQRQSVECILKSSPPKACTPRLMHARAHPSIRPFTSRPRLATSVTTCQNTEVRFHFAAIVAASTSVTAPP